MSRQCRARRVWPSALRPAALLLLLATTGCAARVPYPADWSPVLQDESRCAGPAGSFANQPLSSGGANDPPALQLTEVFFGGLLAGFDVTHLRFEPLAGGQLRVTPWVGSIALQETRTLEPSSRRCRADRWRATTGWEGDGYSTATAAFMTGGLLMPLASKVEFTLHLNGAGELVVHAQHASVNTMALVIPFRTRDREAWHAYGPYSSEPGSDAL